ncbi:nucleotidyltransferase [Symmachiella dynata]|uniref:nucleotidyltransferase domain-containing protein n=1 Tax=Symmachiella dynata TaxID=2527995 RepID=UPI0030EF2583
MKQKSPTTADLLDLILSYIDIPKSLYEKARDRHRSLGEWLCRESSAVRHLNPDIRPQGSFRFGTVNRPLNPDDEYDLDNVCVLTTLQKSDLTQQQLKHLYGEEINAYTREHSMNTPVEECNRCWRLHYADEVSFHLDTLPCVPEEQAVIARIADSGVSDELVRRSVAITDRRHPQYTEITRAWYSSNPRGFAAWFEIRAALGRSKESFKEGIRAAVEDVPPYEWKTTLQRSIQLLKRHRDVMFQDFPDLAPISMIITNLAANAYAGETDLVVALTNIVDRMPDFVRSERPRVPNPADPMEDYADKWSRDPRLEKSFWDWYHALKGDLARLPGLLGTPALSRELSAAFAVDLTKSERELFSGGGSSPTVVVCTPAVVIPSAPKPWGK